jgi:hypothetical protein
MAILFIRSRGTLPFSSSSCFFPPSFQQRRRNGEEAEQRSEPARIPETADLVIDVFDFGAALARLYQLDQFHLALAHVNLLRRK